MLIAVMVIVLLVLVAGYVLSRVAGSSDEVTTTRKRLAAAAEALDAYAGSAARLPCPADPTVDTGVEVTDTAATCMFGEGTLPWRTVGMKREDAYDTWGRKISYRVYTGNNGSLTQPGGASMVDCDTDQVAASVGTTAGAGGFGGLCNVNHNTLAADFILNKGLNVDDSGTPVLAAYVLISHGATGLGGYTVSGARLDLPAGEERNNTRETGAFTIKAFSDVDVAATKGTHFDDLLVYRTVADLARRSNRAARDWPETPTPATAALGIAFNAPTVSTAAGTSVTPGAGVGTGTLTIGGAQVTGRGTGSAVTEIGYGEVVLGGVGYGGIGVAGGGSEYIQSSANEFLRIDFAESFSKFGLTLNDFGFYGFFLVELAEFKFYLNGTPVGTSVIGVGCNFKGALASFSMDVGAEFNRVDIVPLEAFNFFGPPGVTSFLVSEIKACPASDAVCRTAIDDPSNPYNTRCS